MFSNPLILTFLAISWLSGNASAGCFGPHGPRKCSLYRADSRDPRTIELANGFMTTGLEKVDEPAVVWGRSKSAVVATYRDYIKDKPFYLYYIDTGKGRIASQWIEYQERVQNIKQNQCGVPTKSLDMNLLRAQTMTMETQKVDCHKELMKNAAKLVPITWDSIMGYETVKPNEQPSEWHENPEWRKNRDKIWF
ncbi:hypothetical protein PgNI_06654 [Pyricularia grisea]|uniref:Uncharacterized protein n=1 Tax=Pyricularia grisea TaxID=148305 RepID=A0A6P8B455_PYRGI|nr:hypothetical protein PgNI_06654 [Pyricularia grisea]TLD09919.1 hypothetical protein PgNI_06654 [Pyricularia grisea]